MCSSKVFGYTAKSNWIELYLYVYFSALDGFRHNDIPQWSLFCSFDDGSFLLVFLLFFHFHYVVHRVLLLLQLLYTSFVSKWKRILINKFKMVKWVLAILDCYVMLLYVWLSKYRPQKNTNTQTFYIKFMLFEEFSSKFYIFICDLY